MIFSDHDIRAAIGAGRIRVQPEIDSDQIQPASLDIGMGDHLIPVNYGRWGNPYEDDNPTIHAEDGVVTVPPWRRIQPNVATPPLFLAPTYERLTLADDIAAQIDGRSTFAREGLMVHLTAGWVDPGWDGRLTMEIVNFSHKPIEIEVGERVAQAVFFPTFSPSSGYDGQYDGAEGAEQSKRDGE